MICPGRAVCLMKNPGHSATTIAGHSGQLRLCKMGDSQTLIFQGRRHFYEGGGWDPIRFPILLAHRLGVKNLLLTNAAGGIRSSFEVGDMMVLSDHLNFMGDNPLVGPLANKDMPWFPDQTEVYDSTLRSLLVQSGKENDTRIHEGVCVALSGPAFETPAEIRAFGILGADAVGMSTVPEATLGHALGLKVCLFPVSATKLLESLPINFPTTASNRRPRSPCPG